MKYFTRHDGSDVFGIDRDKSDRLTAAINEFHFVSGAVLVDVHDGANVTTIEFFVLYVTIENDQRVLGDHYEASGYAVIKRGGSSSSTIQTVTTRPGR